MPELPIPITIEISTHEIFNWAPYLNPPALWPQDKIPIPIQWSTSPPLGISIVQANALLDVATRTWEAPNCSSIQFQVNSERNIPIQTFANGSNDIFVHTQDWPSPLASNALAHTIVYTSGTILVEADIHINARDYTFATVQVDGTYDLRSVLTHELGHVLGIGHSADVRATMAAGLPFGLAARSLEDDDITAVCSLYSIKSPKLIASCESTRPCPNGYQCIGYQCEQPNEISTLGAPCASQSEPRRCNATGDMARCISITSGEICGLKCIPNDAQNTCGIHLYCANISAQSNYFCIPNGARESSPVRDSGASLSEPSLPNSNSNSCTWAAPSSSFNAFAMFFFILVSTILIRRTRL